MTRDDIIRMAREARCDIAWANSLERFANLVAEAEREACAKSCEDVWNHRKGLETGTALECVVAIRARGEK
jgi:hypothetical protein